jgi:HEAT repeats
MSRQPDPESEINTEMYRLEGESDPLDDELLGADLEELAFAELEEVQYASFEEALEAIQEDSLEPIVLTGFSDITRKQVHELRKVWTKIEDEDTRRVIADHVSVLGLDDIRLDFMRFFRVLLDDPSAAVRQIAASGLEPYDDPALIDPLIQVAQKDPNQDVRLAAIETLGSFAMLAEFEMLDRKDQASLRKALLGLATDAALEGKLRAAALVSASADSMTPNIQAAIGELYASGEPDLRLGALRAMGRANAPEWVGILESTLRSTDPDERQAAVQSLAQYGDESVVPMLTQIAREDLEMPVRLEAIAGLGVQGGRAALHSLNTLREYVSDDEIEAVDAAIAEVEEFIAIEEGAGDEAFLFDPSIDDEF